MLTALSIKAKLIIFGLMVIVVGYLVYDIAIKPRLEVTDLKEQLVEQKKVPTKIVNRINKLDANRTQERINETKIKPVSIIRDNGVLIF